MISSVIAVNRLNGYTRRIKEAHTDILGKVWKHSYEVPLDVSQATLDSNLVIHANKLYAAHAEVDAKNASETDNDITATGRASIELVALAYLREAYTIKDSWESYKKFDKFNSFRIAKGWAINQVVLGLTEVGLTKAEWDLMSARYAYLSNAQRVTAMQNYQLVKDGDIWRDNT